jgi:hypothetical protein
MRSSIRSTAIPGLLLGLLLLGCASDPTAPSTRPAFTGAAFASSERTQLVDVLAFSFCTEEFIPLTGTFHEIFSFTETATGVVKLRIFFRIHAVGTSPTAGKPMVINLFDTFIIPDLDSFFEGTDQSRYVLVTRGSGANEVVRFKYHLTINPNGTVTSSFEEFTISCK